jgi:hypothetical protein
MMNRMIAALFILPLLTSMTLAGPVGWSYTSSRVQNESGNYWVGGTTRVFNELPENGTVSIRLLDLIGSYHVPELISPIPLEGPMLTTRVTLTDTESGQVGGFDLPIVFIDVETAPEGEKDQHVPGIGAFSSQRFMLGRYEYAVSATGASLDVTIDFDRIRTTGVPVATPEPTTLLMAAGGLLVIVGRRFSRKNQA